MSTRVRAFILAAVLLWQSFGMLGSVTVAQRAAELTHLTVHSQSLDHHHHHHTDQALHLGEEDAMQEGGLAQHLHADSGVTPAGLLILFQLSLVLTRSISPLETPQTAWLSPTLDGPLRPPKHVA
jgi:hypothetical protein